MLFTLIRPLEFLQSEDVTNWFGHVHFLGKEKGEIKTLLFDLFYKKRVFQLLWKIKCISRAKPKLNAVFPTTAVDLMWIKWRGGEQCLWKYWIDSLVFYFIVPGRKQTSVGAQKKHLWRCNLLESKITFCLSPEGSQSKFGVRGGGHKWVYTNRLYTASLVCILAVCVFVWRLWNQQELQFGLIFSSSFSSCLFVFDVSVKLCWNKWDIFLTQEHLHVIYCCLEFASFRWLCVQSGRVYNWVCVHSELTCLFIFLSQGLGLVLSSTWGSDFILKVLIWAGFW